jgi:hypothetical protein
VVLLYSTVLKMMAIDMLHCDGYGDLFDMIGACLMMLDVFTGQ